MEQAVAICGLKIMDNMTPPRPTRFADVAFAFPSCLRMTAPPYARWSK
jgi:hypothetical protein